MSDAPVFRFRAMWPVADASLTVAELASEARDDLPAVALRHGVRVVGAPLFTIAEGRAFPGSGGAQTVVVADVAVVRLRDLADGREHARDAAAIRKSPTDTGACGTTTGYQRHARAQQHPCAPCREARAEYMAAWRQKEAS